MPMISVLSVIIKNNVKIFITYILKNNNIRDCSIKF